MELLRCSRFICIINFTLQERRRRRRKNLNQIKVLLGSDNEIIFVTSQRAVKRKDEWYKRDERDYETTTTTATSAYYNSHSQNTYKRIIIVIIIIIIKISSMFWKSECFNEPSVGKCYAAHLPLDSNLTLTRNAPNNNDHWECNGKWKSRDMSYE